MLLRRYLPALGLLGLAGCFPQREKNLEEPLSYFYHEPRLADVVGEYRLTDQHVLDTLALTRLSRTRLVLRRDHTFTFTHYPCFTDRDTVGWTLDSLADFTGRWRFRFNGVLADTAAPGHSDFWLGDFSPEPGPRRPTGYSPLTVLPYHRASSPRLTSLYLYYGDVDSNDYLRYEPVPPPARPRPQ